MTDVQIPGKAVSDAADVRAPVRSLLEDLNLLGSVAETEKAEGFKAAFAGPPQSVAVIEAGATAAAKYWGAGLGASAIATWGSLVAWWGDQEGNVQVAAIAGALFVTAAVAIAIGHLLASDVRGRAAASVATIEARALVAETMIRAAGDAYEPPSAISQAQIVPLPSRIRVNNLEEAAGDEEGWLAVAMERQPDGALKYIVVRDSKEAKVLASKLEFVR
jgi:hypothetical protein